jgi:hypothetical protein
MLQAVVRGTILYSMKSPLLNLCLGTAIHARAQCRSSVRAQAPTCLLPLIPFQRLFRSPGMEGHRHARETRIRIHGSTRGRHGTRRPSPTSYHGPGCRTLRGHTAGAKHLETPFSGDSTIPQTRRSMVPSHRTLVPAYKIHRLPCASRPCNLSS